MSPEKAEQRTGGKHNFSIIHILFVRLSRFWQLYIFIFPSLSLSNSFVCLPWSVFIHLPLALSFSHNRVWTRGSFSTGLAAAGGQRKRGRESKRRGGLADAPCYFSSASHWLCQQWLSLSRASELRGAWQHALFSDERELIADTLRGQNQEEVAFIIALPLFPCKTFSFLLDFVLVVPASFCPFHNFFLLVQATNPLEWNPNSLLGSN